MSLDDRDAIHDDAPKSAGPPGPGSGGFYYHDLRLEDDHTRVVLTVPEGNPWFEGHFPGQPILPAVAQVGLVQNIHRMGGLALIVGIHSLRLIAPVRPNDVVELTFGFPEEDWRGHIGVRSWNPDGEPESGDKRSQGVVQWRIGEPEPVPWEPAPYPADEAGIESGLPDRLPHTGPARLARAVLELGEDHLVCRGRVPADSPSTDRWPPFQAWAQDSPDPGPPEGHAGSWMALELAAQAAGLLEAAHRKERGEEEDEPRVGYLVRVRDALFAHPFLPVEAPLLARVRRTGGSGPLTLYDFTVELERAGGETPVELVSGSLGTFVPSAEGKAPGGGDAQEGQ